jgi:hypothetical protein
MKNSLAFTNCHVLLYSGTGYDQIYVFPNEPLIVLDYSEKISMNKVKNLNVRFFHSQKGILEFYGNGIDFDIRFTIQKADISS